MYITLDNHIFNLKNISHIYLYKATINILYPTIKGDGDEIHKEINFKSQREARICFNYIIFCFSTDIRICDLTKYLDDTNEHP